MKARISYKAMDSWLEPYIGHIVDVVRWGKLRSVIDLGYGSVRCDTICLEALKQEGNND